jgi:quercetin dioxygenase-like cupin family protein
VTTCPPDKKHWHGATDRTAMGVYCDSIIKDGRNVEWLEKVADEQYFIGAASLENE